MTIEKPPKYGGRETLAAIGDQALPYLKKRYVRLAANKAEQIIPMRLDALGTMIPARRHRGRLARGMETPNPANGAGDADPETLGRRIARQAPFDHRINHTFAKIVGKRHRRRFLGAAIIFKHNEIDLGIRHDSIRWDTALGYPANK